MAPPGTEQKPHVPPPSLWPVGFAVGVAILLTGLVVGWFIVVLGAVLTVAFGFLWIRDVTSEMRGHVPEIEPERREVPATATAEPLRADEGPPAMPPTSEEELERYPRAKFLEASTLGIAGLIGGVVTVPILGFAVAPAFVDNVGAPDVDIGAIEDFPENEWRIVTFLHDPEVGEVSRRTAYIRYNGQLEGEPSFTVISNRCVHLGCPVQPNALIDDQQAKTTQGEGGEEIRMIPATGVSGFGCPCHGGQYDTEGNRTAGPPVRSLDRYSFAIKDGRVVLTGTFSVGKVEGTGKDAKIVKYDLSYPGNHVDGVEQILYPIQPPR
jgi:menaquinol-cytochrome c reductase iron-sulfur subunit